MTRIGIIPQPVGTQVLLTKGDRRITRIATIETKTLARKPMARYFSTKLDEFASVPVVEGVFTRGLLAILLEYWLG
jgi:hypothetical protein